MKPTRPRRQITLKNSLIAATACGVLLLAFAAILWYLWPSDTVGEYRFVSTIAGQSGEIGEPFGLAVSGTETYISDGQNGKVIGLSSSGKTILEENFDTPSGIAFGNGEHESLLVVDTGRNTIYKIDKSPIAIAGTSEPGFADGDASTARFNGPIGIAAGKDGKVFISDTYNDRIRVIEKGQVTTLAGSSKGFSDGVGPAAKFDTPTGLAIWNDKLLVADTGNRRIRVVEMDGTVWTLAGNGEGDLGDGLLSMASFVQPTALTVDTNGVIFVADGNGIRRIGGNMLPAVTTISSDSRGDTDGPAAKASFNRPSGLAIAANGDLLVADSENQLVRSFSVRKPAIEDAKNIGRGKRETAEEFRNAAPARWPYDPPNAVRDIAGTLGEIRGTMTPEGKGVWFHNGLDIAGAYGETARFIRDEKVLKPIAAENFGTLRELIRMPTLGYIHIRLGRDQASTPFTDPRFQFQSENGKLTGVRVPRGTKFKAGDPIGTLNSMNHVHLVAGRSGSEMNALDALILPGISDSRPPVIEKVELYDENWKPIETVSPNSRMKLTGKTRIVVRAYDQMDGNSERRRLGVYSVSLGMLGESPIEHAVINEIKFDQMPSNDLVKFVYANGSHSGATGETIFRYIATNSLMDGIAREGFFDASTMPEGNYLIGINVTDYFGNTAERDILVEVKR